MKTKTMTHAEMIAALAYDNTALTAREAGWRGNVHEWPEYEAIYRATVDSYCDSMRDLREVLECDTLREEQRDAIRAAALALI